jgi:RimJ/RimL family protein N-acetyltransferase
MTYCAQHDRQCVRYTESMPSSDVFPRASDRRSVLQRLETPRLFLREMRAADVESLHRLFSDPLLMRFWPVFTRAETEQWVAANQRRYAQDGFGLWAVTFKSSDEAIGDCGMVRHEVDGTMETGIGWHLLREHWGRGYATEAAAASRDYAFAQLGVERLVASIHPENYASRRVAEKIGMRLIKEYHHWRGLRLLYALACDASAHSR